ncbi:hypothetical protein XACM_3179 [Xanthomonas euvesicatoria pv. citrumelo F1]|nr:hypothetical protein XACM_3179 [Xanthomonas euvesicatoria pv. citrumelo F1]
MALAQLLRYFLKIFLRKGCTRGHHDNSESLSRRVKNNKVFHVPSLVPSMCW